MTNHMLCLLPLRLSSRYAASCSPPTRVQTTRPVNNGMNKLEDLPAVSRIDSHVVRVLGQNPGKFTLQGTNTYLIGTQNPYTLIDVAEGKDEYIPLLDQALNTLASPTNPSLPDVSDIIISHWHHDHTYGLPSVLNLLRTRWQARKPTSPYIPPRLHKYPVPPNDTSGASTDHNKLQQVVSSLPPDSYTPTPTGSSFHELSDGQIFRSSPPTIRVLHTPGHTIDSIALDIVESRALYTADTVLGEGTSVFEDLALYIQSLHKMLKHGDGDAAGYRTLYPAHGPVVRNGRELISTYIKHRLEREQQILETLRKPPLEGDDWTTWTIVKTLYASYPETLWAPAARSVELHLRKLVGEGIITRLGGEGVETSWKPVARTLSPSL